MPREAGKSLVRRPSVTVPTLRPRWAELQGGLGVPLWSSAYAAHLNQLVKTALRPADWAGVLGLTSVSPVEGGCLQLLGSSGCSPNAASLAGGDWGSHCPSRQGHHESSDHSEPPCVSVWVAGGGRFLNGWTLGNKVRELKESESWLSMSTLVFPSGIGDMGHRITRHLGTEENH